MNKSGVDFLIEEVKSNEWQDKFIWHKQEVFDKAKAMHKEEIMDARRNGSYKVTEKYGETRTNIQYYNETFKDNNKQK